MKRKNLLNPFILSFLIALSGRAVPSVACAGGCPEGTCGLASITFAMPRSVITADTLVVLLKSANTSLIEYRKADQKSDMKIPGAMVICDNVAAASMSERLPARENLLIVYPGLENVDMTSLIAELRKLGYQSVIEFQPGIQGWLTYGYNVEEGNRP